MKMLGCSAALVAGATIGMVVGAYLVMEKPCVRKMCKHGYRKAKKMLNM